MTATHKTVTGIMRIENLRHKVYMDNFSSPELFDTKAINCCGTVRLNQKEMPRDFGTTFKLKQGDLTIILWKDKCNIKMLTNMYPPPAEGNFCHEHGNAQKPTIVKNYNRDTGYTDKNNHMANSYSISKRTWNWTRKLSPSRLANSEQFYSHHLLWCILTHRDFRLVSVKDLIQETTPSRRSTPLTDQPT
jgi:hypothetical protein